MSNIYIQEPLTQGKVLLETTVGDIEIELWSRECPKACKNFIQLCMENYYNKTPFHRVVRDFIVQGGDPTGSGTGGQSIYGHPFKDEFHTRLRFVRRGLVAMANAGKDDNGSQFFFTFGPTEELQNKHTIFGKVVGNTIYNMLKLQEGGLVGEKPENPHQILKTKVLNNPFPDLQPRKLIEMIKEKKTDKRQKSNMKATKDFSLLSFGDEAEEEEEDLKEANKAFVVTHGKSSHDLLKDPKLSSKVGMELQGDKGEEEEASPEESETEEQPQSSKKEVVDITSIQQKLKKSQTKTVKSKVMTKVASDDDNDDEDEDMKEKLKKRDEILKEIKAIKREMKGDRGGGGVGSKGDDEDDPAPTKKPKEDMTEEEKGNDLLLSFHKEREVYASKKTGPKKGTAREAMTMQLLEKFKSKLHAVKDEGSSKASDDPVKDGGEEEEEVAGDGWMANALQFDKNDVVLAKDASSKDDDWFDIFDPRNPVNKRRRGEKEKEKSKTKP